MSNELKTFSKNDWKQFVSTRTLMFKTGETKILEDKEIECPIEFTSQLLRLNTDTILPVYFINCVFKESVNVGNYIMAGDIYFKNCVFEKKTKIASTENIKFEESCQFKNDLAISISPQGSIISNIKVDGRLSISGRSENKIIIENVNIQSSTAKQTLNLLLYCDSLEIDNSMFAELNFMGDSTFENDVSIKRSDIGKIEAYSININGLLQIFQTTITEFSILSLTQIGERLIFYKNTITKRFSLPLSCFTTVEIFNNTIEELRLTDTNKTENVISIQKNTLNYLVFSRVYNNGLISLKGLSISTGAIRIHSSNLGKTDFIVCDFKNATLDFENSKLTDIFLADTEFPKKVLSNGQLSPQQAQLAFGQISTAYQKQGDTVRALEYQSREIEAHFHNLKLYDKESNEISFTKISLWLNKISNNFGRSWQRGLLFSILVGIIFFYGVIINSKEYHIGLPLSFDSRLFIAYMRFMNPLRFFELDILFKQNGDKPFLTLSAVSYFYDFLGRVFIAYGFYQTIQAFRKYGRK